MKDHLYSKDIIEEKTYIWGIPTILLRPRDLMGTIPTIIFYHGWGSTKESQRIRGLIYATVGYQVLIPDAIYHGERNPIEYTSANGKYFWETIFNNIEESNLLIEAAIKNHNADYDNISVIGSSMGGFTAAGIFTFNPSIKSLVVLNGSCAWRDSNEELKKELTIEMSEEIKDIEKRIDELDPINHLELLKDRSILMLHGDSDSSVPIDSQRLFLQKIQPLYKDKEKIKLITYPGLNHYVTTNMMEESIYWLKR